MSALSPFYSQLVIATAALGFAHSYTLTALEGEPSLLLLEAAISDAETALWYLMHAADALEETHQATGAATASWLVNPTSLKVG